jgi:hypothetical protein
MKSITSIRHTPTGRCLSLEAGTLTSISGGRPAGYRPTQSAEAQPAPLSQPTFMEKATAPEAPAGWKRNRLFRMNYPHSAEARAEVKAETSTYRDAVKELDRQNPGAR